MFPNMPVQASKQERHLVKLFKSLDASKKETLVAFAEFLQARSDDSGAQQIVTSVELEAPLEIDRPDEESVIKAIKRLKSTYPMVDPEILLHPISDLMTAHMLQGKEAEIVIDELEHLFKQEYQALNPQT